HGNRGSGVSFGDDRPFEVGDRTPPNSDLRSGHAHYNAGIAIPKTMRRSRFRIAALPSTHPSAACCKRLSIAAETGNRPPHPSPAFAARRQAILHDLPERTSL